MTASKTFIMIVALAMFLAALPAENLDAAPKEKIKADIAGAGATFPAPLYRRWIEVYKEQHPDTSISYEAVGSGDGIRMFLDGEVDFGASDAAMSDAQMQQAPNGAQLIPATAGIIVLAYNLPGVTEQLKLSRQVYTDIFLGKITQWNDPAIQKDNPGVALPDRGIVIVARSDSSGTTFAMTNHLNAVSNQWRDRGPGVGKKIQWPGRTMLGRGNGGVARKIQISIGAIGYVEYGYAQRAGLAMAILENKAGHFVEPSPSSGSVTLKNNFQKLPKNLRLFMPDPEGATSYPIITYSWLLLQKHYLEAGKRDKLLRFVRWALQKGQKYATDFGYTPLPEEVARKGLEALDTIQ